jgi:hypothetical protein
MPDLSASGVQPYWAGIVFTGLLACDDVTLSLFEEDDLARKSRLAATIDRLNARHGHVVDLLPLFVHHGQAPHRIAFGAPDPAPPERAGEKAGVGNACPQTTLLS